ncbi:MAG: AAA family ATPase [Potamolinea sp.]
MTNNEKYLSAALTWLRLRLERLCSDDVALSVTDEKITQAAQAMIESEALEAPPALVILSQRLGLSRFEQQVLLLCAVMELDTQIASLCASAQGQPHRRYPTFALALTLFDEPAWDILSPERPLRYWRLIEINQPSTEPLTTSPIRADERIVNYIKGLNYLDDRLAPLLSPLDVAECPAELPPSQKTAVETILRRLEQSTNLQNTPVIQLLGVDSASKQFVARHTAATFGLHLYRLAVELLPSQSADLETFARLWERESILLPIALYLDAQEGENCTQTVSPLQRFLARSSGLFFLESLENQPRLGRNSVAVDIAKPTPAEQEAAWIAVLGLEEIQISALLSRQFNLSLWEIRQIGGKVVAEKGDDQSFLEERLWQACLVSTRPKFEKLAQRLDAKATWDDIVLPAEDLVLLHRIADQVGQRSTVYEDWGFRRKMNRGLGISVLFAGESGTGKTMAAEVIANDLRLDLYRIDLSAVVSKYIGETEKNLRRLFDAAEDSGAILFFDEADALFGKRSEVKDSHDRYANIEINYLLQRMEAYSGLAILATNMKSALDVAFMRRLRFIVNFAFPDKSDRQRMWQKVFPSATPILELDYERLARFNLTGGSIHNIALSAAFLAAKLGEPVSMQLVLEAARTEFRKLDKPINEADFRSRIPTGLMG